MIERIPIDHKFYIVVADEPTSELSAILKLASEDKTHPLADNYDTLSIARFSFYTVLVYDKQPMMFYGTEKAAWMPDHVARAYCRFYKHPDFRRQKTWLMQIEAMKIALDYDEYEPWLQKHDIKTLLFTRNAADKKDAVRFFTNNESTERVAGGKGSFTKKGWTLYPHICNINNTSQRVYWRGDEDLGFLASLQQLDVPPTRID